MEIWKDIEGYEGLYKISSSKQVKSFHKGKERIRKPFESDYSRIVLSKNKEIKTFLLHVLLAKVLMSTKDGEPIKVFPSQAEAARQTGLSQGNIWAACTGRRKTAGGYIWTYV